MKRKWKKKGKSRTSKNLSDCSAFKIARNNFRGIKIGGRTLFMGINDAKKKERRKGKKRRDNRSDFYRL